MAGRCDCSAAVEEGPPRRGLWDEETGFFYDMLRTADGREELIKVRAGARAGWARGRGSRQRPRCALRRRSLDNPAPAHSPHTLARLAPGSQCRSFVGLIPLFAVHVIDADVLRRLPRFRRRMEWFVKYRPHLARVSAPCGGEGCACDHTASSVNCSGGDVCEGTAIA